MQTLTSPSTITPPFVCRARHHNTSNRDDGRDYSFDVHIVTSLHDDPAHSFSDHTPFEPAPAKQSLILPPLVHGSTFLQLINNSAGTYSLHSRQRSLTSDLPGTNVPRDAMSASLDDAPGSPPGLTTSKSSKSSTNPSSTSNNGDPILSDVSHFEDIGLHEDMTPAPPAQRKNDTHRLKASAPRAVTASASLNNHNPKSVSTTSVRDLTNPAPRSPVLPPPGPFNGLTSRQALAPAPRRPMRKFSRNASTPSLAIQAMSNYNRSRSPSPHTSPPMPLHSAKQFANPRPMGKTSPRSPHAPQMPVRRGSWQPSRKSVKELEAECNDEDEEDLPDEASLWNVPISPRPMGERQNSLSPIASPRVSPGGSPERSSPLRTSIGADGIQHTAPKPIPLPVTRRTLPADFQSPPATPSNLLPGSSTGSMQSLPKYQRSKSWNIAHSELSDEAKALTQSLELHADSRGADKENAFPRSELDGMQRLSRTRTAPVIQLPPLRANNIMIDPLPISKEKERVLSRTRPSWLPPKDPNEEKRHLKEYQKMMELSQAAERKKAAKTADSQCAKDDAKSTLLQLWEQHVLPNWGQVIREPRTRELWWRGVPPKSRGQVWARAIGNELALTETSFQKALQRARAIQEDLRRNNSNAHRRERTWFDAIHRDVQATFPDLKIFQSGAPLHDSLVDILTAYAMYRSDVGYSHGTHLIAAFLLLSMPTSSQTFISLANLMNRPLPLAFLTGDPAGEQKAYDLTVNLLHKKYPRLHDHLFSPRRPSAPSTHHSHPHPPPAEPTPPPTPTSAATTSTTDRAPSLHLHPREILEPILRSLFLGPSSGLGLDVAARVWDVMLFDGDTAVIRTAVALLGHLEGKLYGSRTDVLNILGWSGKVGDVGDEDIFMGLVRTVGKEAVPKGKPRK